MNLRRLRREQYILGVNLTRSMIPLLTYPTRVESVAFQKRTEDDLFSHRVWELHRVIADPASEAGDVKNAKLSLLRTLRKSRVFDRAIPRPFLRSIEKE